MDHHLLILLDVYPYVDHQQSIISLEILESPFLKKRWFLEHLELI